MESYRGIHIYKRIVQAKLFIENHYAYPLNLENMAGEAYFSKYHFIRQFKKIYGQTPYQFLIKVRIEKAKQLLQSGVTVSEVCNTVGFESLSSFSGLFRRIAGISPSAYAIEQQNLRTRFHETPFAFIPGCHLQPT